jgi:hypothetical protein
MKYVVLARESSPWPSHALLLAIESGIDYLLIDGDHRTKWVITDYHYWQRYVRKGGYIAFHDWTGAGGVEAEIKRAVGIIMETDKLEEIVRVRGPNRGLIVFRKTWEGAQ